METEIVKWDKYYIKKLVHDHITIGVNDDIMEFLNRIDIKGKNVIDGGSNIGSHALLFCDLVGNEGKVFCFEIQEVMNNLTVENASINNKSEYIICHHLALSDTTGKNAGHTYIDYFGENLSSSGIKTELMLPRRTTTVTIDDMNIENVGFIKLDLEGHEPQALNGAWNTIDKYKPYMLVELSSGYLLNRQHETVEKIEAHGYLVEQISDCNYCCSPIL